MPPMTKMQTKTSLLFALPVALVFTVGSYAFTQDGADAAQEDATVEESPEDEAKASHERMERAMKGLKKSQRVLKALVGDAATNRDAILKELSQMENMARAAYAEAPPKLTGKEFSADEWSLHVIRYKTGMLDLQGQLLAMQTAAIKGDAKALQTGYENLNAAKKKGHREFQDE